MEYITLKTFDTAIGAHILKNRLEGEGINCQILDENIVTLDPLLNFAVGGIRLQVKDCDRSKALLILEEIENTPFTDADDENINCPNCKSTSLYSDFNSMKEIKGVLAIIVSFILGVFPIYKKSVFKCKECNTEFEKKGHA